jgi:hypothetical protein
VKISDTSKRFVGAVLSNTLSQFLQVQLSDERGKQSYEPEM